MKSAVSPRRFAALLVAALLAALAGGPAEAQPALRPDGLPLPRFVSLRSEEVNLRAGPGVRYPVEWVFRRRTLPVEVLAEFEQWRLALEEGGRASCATTKRIRKLERELARKEKALAEAAALLVLKKTVESLYDDVEDGTAEENEK